MRYDVLNVSGCLQFCEIVGFCTIRVKPRTSVIPVSVAEKRCFVKGFRKAAKLFAVFICLDITLPFQFVQIVNNVLRAQPCKAA